MILFIIFQTYKVSNILLLGCTGNKCNHCHGAEAFVNGQCPETFECTNDSDCNNQGTCGTTEAGNCDCNESHLGIDCFFNTQGKENQTLLILQLHHLVDVHK